MPRKLKPWCDYPIRTLRRGPVTCLLCNKPINAGDRYCDGSTRCAHTACVRRMHGVTGDDQYRLEDWWNWCSYCDQAVDADDVFDGEEVRCYGCDRTYTCTYLSDGKWRLVETTDEEQK